jgi:hypothetical protein
MFGKKLNNFFDENMLQVSGFARVLLDRTDSVRSERALVEGGQALKIGNGAFDQLQIQSIRQ